ncbi:hypothetical protein Tco_1227017 [Tanacetum coccineum]
MEFITRKMTDKTSSRQKSITELQAMRSDKHEYSFSYADLPRLNLNDIEDMYLLKVQDKMHHLLSKYEKDFNNALPLFIQRTVIKNRVEDLQLVVESYQRTLNLTKPKFYFEGIDEKTPYTTTGTEKGVQENLIDMINKNEQVRGNARLRGRDWNDKDVKRSEEMLDKIDQVIKHREQLRKLEEYVNGRPKTIDPRSFVRHM